MSDEHLKKRLETTRQGAYNAPIDTWELTQQMLEPHLLGHPDPYLRDALVYPTLANWIARQVLSDDQTRTVLGRLLSSDCLFFQLGKSGDESVLVRSFAALQVAAILNRHLKRPFLTPDEVLGLVLILLRYLEGEKDLRGY